MMRVALVAALSITMASAAAAQTAQTDAKPDGTATIRGRITDATTGKPLRRARVMLNLADFRPGQPFDNRSTSTDPDGKYEFTNVVAGRYGLSASKNGYGSWSFGQTRPRDGGRPIDIADKSLSERLDIALPAAALITGRVVDEFGDPAIEAQVSLMRLATANGARRMQTFSTVSTNDAGEFRMTMPMEGQYYLAASMRAMSLPPDITERIGWARTYYPSTAESSEARRLTLRPGTTINDIAIQLIPARPVRVSGSVVAGAGRQPTGNVSAFARSDFNGFGGNGVVRPDGTFVIEGMTPGAYTLQLNGPNNVDGAAATADIVVGADDLENVTLVLTPPITASGRIVADAQVLAAVKPSTLRVNTNPAPVNGVFMNFGGSPPPTPVADDFTFEVKAHPGQMRVNVMGLPAGWMVHSVRAGTEDVTEKGIDFRAGKRITDIEIELTNKTTTVLGTAHDDRGNIPADFTVVMFTQDRERWPTNSRLRTARPTQTGQFKLSGMPAGDYYVIALPSADYEELSDPEFLEKVRSSATRVSLVEGDTKSLDLRLEKKP